MGRDVSSAGARWLHRHKHYRAHEITPRVRLLLKLGRGWLRDGITIEVVERRLRNMRYRDETIVEMQ